MLTFVSSDGKIEGGERHAIHIILSEKPIPGSRENYKSLELSLKDRLKNARAKKEWYFGSTSKDLFQYFKNFLFALAKSGFFSENMYLFVTLSLFFPRVPYVRLRMQLFSVNRNLV